MRVIPGRRSWAELPGLLGPGFPSVSQNEIPLTCQQMNSTAVQKIKIQPSMGKVMCIILGQNMGDLPGFQGT